MYAVCRNSSIFCTTFINKFIQWLLGKYGYIKKYNMKKEELKKQILELTREYYREVHGQKQEFVPGKTKVNYGGGGRRW